MNIEERLELLRQNDDIIHRCFRANVGNEQLALKWAVVFLGEERRRLINKLHRAYKLFGTDWDNLTENAMKPKPKPKVELVVTLQRDISCIDLVYASEDAKDFIVRETSSFGDLYDPIDHKSKEYRLYVSPTYDIDEVVEYLESYNEK